MDLFFKKNKITNKKASVSLPHGHIIKVVDVRQIDL